VNATITVQVRRLSPRVGEEIPLPFYATAGAAAMDLCACLEQETVIPPLGRARIPTGIAVAIPAGVVGLVFARSGNAYRAGISLSNAVGVIDSDYRGEIQVLLSNLDPQRAFVVRPGDRIAQLAFLPVLHAQLAEVEELAPTARGEGGFGSTGS
jgi:dUTP pyrophosphatase